MPRQNERSRATDCAQFMVMTFGPAKLDGGMGMAGRRVNYAGRESVPSKGERSG